MRIPRIYFPDALHPEQTVVLPKEAAVHISNVLRLKEAHPIVLFNGDGNEYSGELSQVTKRQTLVTIDSRLGVSVESPLQIHLAQGVSKGDRMDMVMQKSVELGVTDITPILTERCTVKLNNERWEKKHQHWYKVITSACEQCGRNILPVLHPPISLYEFLQQSTPQLRLTLNPNSEHRFTHLALPKAGVRLLIGPEGGLSDTEIYQATELGYHSVLMGPRILRTETAALSAIAILQAQFGDI